MEEPLSATYHIGLLVFVVVSAIVLALLMWATVTRRSQKEQREGILLRLGYTLTSPPPQLVAQITKLHRRRGDQAPDLQNVYGRPIAGGEIYFFDLIDTGGSETSTRAAGALTVVSSTLDLPRFALMPRPDYLPQSSDGGMLAKLADVALDAAAAQIGLVELAYPDDHEFAENFIVLAEDETATRAFLDNRLRTQLLQLERRYVIDAVENTFTLSHNFVVQPAPLSEEGLQTQREDAERTLSLFRRSEMTYT
ncbi:MAG: hypothetical protein MUQ30_19130 [Anaerolineae bacterium]|nr:hypothetical protein [Anaerolineae bacterium]